MKIENKSNESSLLYLYCISDKEPNFEDGANTEGLSTFKFKSFYSIVRSVSEEDFGKENIERNINSIQWLEKHVRMHEAVIENVMLKGYTVIPFKFATVFCSEDTLSLFLEKYAEALTSKLNELKDKEEWGVKIYCNTEQVEKFVKSTNQQVLDFNTQILNASQGKAYFMKKKQDELIRNVVKEKTYEYANGYYSYLKKIAENSKENKLQAKELTGKAHEMILNSVFLLDRNSVLDFSKTALELKPDYEKKGLIIDITGPWPPYNFCEINEMRT